MNTQLALEGDKLLIRRGSRTEVRRADDGSLLEVVSDPGPFATRAPPPAGSFTGLFISWFRDGTHFLTSSLGATEFLESLRVYSADGALVQTVAWPHGESRWATGEGQVGGENGYFWLAAGPDPRTSIVHVYRIHEPKPILTFEGAPVAGGSRTTMPAFHRADDTLVFMDLRGSAPALRTVRHDHGDPRYASVDAEGRWVYTENGVIFDGSRLDERGLPTALGHGELRSMDATLDKLAIATTDCTTRIYTLRAGVLTLSGKIEGILPWRVTFSADGHFLFIQGQKDGTSRALNNALYAYEVDDDGRPTPEPALDILSSPPQASFTVSATGARVAQTGCHSRNAATTCTVTIYERGRPIFSAPPIPGYVTTALLSPSGRRFIVSVGERRYDVYEDFSIKTQLTGMGPDLWIDEDRLLVSRAGESWIVDLMGPVSVRMEDWLSRAASAGPGRIHDDESIYSVSDGRVLWNAARDADVTRDRYTPTAVVGHYFVFLQGSQIRVVAIGAD